MVYDTYLKDELEEDTVQEEVLVEDKKEFFNFIEQEWERSWTRKPSRVYSFALCAIRIFPME